MPPAETRSDASPATNGTSHQEIVEAWWKEASIYQIYPSSFKDTNGDGIGDIPGIISKLDYLKRLGTDVVWLCPIFSSPQRDMGYDISNYKDIYPPYGTLNDVDELIKGLHDRDMKCVLDLVVNHTSNEHEWFKKSRSSEDSEYRDWYHWRKPKYDSEGNRQPPNNWTSIFGGSAWEYDEVTDAYYLHLFLKEQPDLNWENPKVRDAVCDIMRFWLDRGCDGFRIDAINFISKVEGLPDGGPDDYLAPRLMGAKYFINGPKLHDYLKMIGGVLKEYDAFSVGEMGGLKDMEEVLRTVHKDSGELNMVIHFEVMEIDHGPDGLFTPREWPLSDLKHIVSRWQTFMHENHGWNALYLENHDQSRTVSRFTSAKTNQRAQAAKMLATFLSFQAGTLFIYQGQELAMANIPSEWGIEEYKDEASQRVWQEIIDKYGENSPQAKECLVELNKKARDNCRLPMQWDSSPNAGFSTGKPWMRVNTDYEEWNAASQLDDPNSVFNYYQNILQLRKEYRDIFIYGDYQLLLESDDNLFVYKRTYKGDSAVVVVNFYETPVTVDVSAFGGLLKKVILSNVDVDIRGKETLELGAFEAFVGLLL
ncbi:Alpha-glucosidase [Dactylella cylindrospora]|nr:Alpha-glucosidase [Dactylella cylindrospora]